MVVISWMNTGLCPQQSAQSTMVVISWMNTGLCPQQSAQSTMVVISWMNTGLCPQQSAQSTMVVISWMNTGLCPQQFALGNSTSIPGQQQCCHDIVSNNSWWILYFLFICILSLEYNSLGSNCIPGAVLQCVLFCCVMHKSYHVNWAIKMV